MVEGLSHGMEVLSKQKGYATIEGGESFYKIYIYYEYVTMGFLFHRGIKPS